MSLCEVLVLGGELVLRGRLVLVLRGVVPVALAQPKVELRVVEAVPLPAVLLPRRQSS